MKKNRVDIISDVETNPLSFIFFLYLWMSLIRESNRGLIIQTSIYRVHLNVILENIVFIGDIKLNCYYFWAYLFPRYNKSIFNCCQTFYKLFYLWNRAWKENKIRLELHGKFKSVSSKEFSIFNWTILKMVCAMKKEIYQKRYILERTRAGFLFHRPLLHTFFFFFTEARGCTHN